MPMQSLAKPWLLAISLSLGAALPASALAQAEGPCRLDLAAAETHGFSTLLGDSFGSLHLDKEQAKVASAIEEHLRGDRATFARASEDLLLAVAAQLPSGHVELRPLHRELATYVAAEAAYRDGLRAALDQAHELLGPTQRQAFAKALREKIDQRASLYDSSSWLDTWATQLSLSEEQKQKVREVIETQKPSLTAERQQFAKALASFGGESFALSRVVPKQRDSVLALASALRTIQTTNAIAAILNQEQRDAAVKALRGHICQPSRESGYGYAFPYAGGFGAMP